MAADGPVPHVLQELVFPDRYETLESVLGPEVSRLVVAPDKSTALTFQTLAEDVRARHEGMFVPISASTGTGKTTLANNLATFFPADYRSSVAYAEPTVTFEHLTALASEAATKASANERRILPVVVDGRESAPPSDAELAAMKRFVREQNVGYRAVVLWPETDDEIAVSMSDRYVGRAGSAAIELPARVAGPARDTWQQIAVQTLDLANQAADLERLGVDPRTYDPESAHTLGEFLRRISQDFTALRVKLLRSTEKPLRLSIVFATASTDAGVLLQLTNSNRFGLLDGGALLSATPKSDAGRFWQKNRGLLTQLIVQLDAHAFSLPPQVTIPSLRRHGPEGISGDLEQLGISKSRDHMIKAWRRSEFGKFLNGSAKATFENRGTPADTSTSAFALIAEKGLTAGKDKQLNRAMILALSEYLADQDLGVTETAAETKLTFAPLIPDNTFVLNGDQHCIEYTWRTGEFLGSSRADAAEYVLTKLRNYGRELGRLE